MRGPLIPVLALGGGDCERLTHGLLAQPANTVSSVAFLRAGLWIVLRARRAAGHRVELAIFGVAVASNAVGGVMLHGFHGPWARWVHDLSLLSVLLFIAVFDAARFLSRPTVWMTEVYLACLAGLGLLLAFAPGTTDALSAVLGVAAGAGELEAYLRDLPVIRASGLTARRLARMGVLVALALGATAFLLGRTGAPLCRPGSEFQWHAVWHVLAAVAMCLYAYGAIEPHPASAEHVTRAAGRT